MQVPGTLQALGVALLALLPGASFTFAFERVAGPFGASLSDRLVRFLAGSSTFHAVAAGFEYGLYRDYVRTGALQDGAVSIWLVEGVALFYVFGPWAFGILVGTAWQRDWRWSRLVTGLAPASRAWDHLFARGPQGYLRARLKSGRWVAGYFGPAPDGGTSFAASVVEGIDILIARTIEVDSETGSFILENGEPKSRNSALLLRWEDIELLEFTESR
jgi:hypothetical protein